MATILLIDDDVDFCSELQRSLEGSGHRVDRLENPIGAPERLAEKSYDVVLLDNRMPCMSGIDFLAALDQRKISIPVILMTGEPTSDTAIQAMNLGAFDYVVKPLDIDELIGELGPLIADAEEIVRLTNERVRLPGDRSPGEGPELLGNGRPMQDVYKLIGKVAGSNAPVLILGETGSGKELVARAIHNNSPRRDRPFVAMNCTALNENLLDDELFGHEPRSFSGAGDKLRKGRFEHAHGGTLFLDEIGDMPAMLQAKLLRVLENSEVVRIGGNEPIKVDVRVVSATHCDLNARIEAGDFRQDLMFRINGVTIHVPALRERGVDDIRLLIHHFLKRAAKTAGRPVPTISETAWTRLRDYEWPGNVRELQHVVRRAVLVCRGSQIMPGDLEHQAATNGVSPDAEEHEPGWHLARAVKEAIVSGRTNLHAMLHDALDAELLRVTLAEHDGNQVQTARRLGLSRNGLRARMRALGLE